MPDLDSRLRPLLVERLPVDVDEGLAVHAVDVEDSIQVVHLVLEDSSGPAAGLPRDVFTLLVQTCKEDVRRKYKSRCPIQISNGKTCTPDTSTDR